MSRRGLSHGAAGVSVAAGIAAALALLALGACEPRIVELDRPEVATTTPLALATDVELEPAITITFDEPMVDDRGAVRRAGNLEVLTHVWEDEETVRVALAAPLRPLTTYELIASDFANPEGIAIEAYAWSFTTGRPDGCGADGEAPTITHLTAELPWDLSVTELTLELSEAVIGLDGSTVAVDEPARIDAISGEGASYVIALDHLRMGAEQRVTFGPGITDLCANPLAPIEVPFVVACEATPPQVTSGPCYGHDPALSEGYLLRVTEPVFGLEAATLTPAAGVANIGTDLDLAITQLGADAYLLTPAASDWRAAFSTEEESHPGDAFVLTIPTTVADACGNTLAEPFTVAIDVLDCFADTEAPLMWSPNATLFDVGAPLPYQLIFSETVDGVIAGARTAGLSGNVGSDLSMTVEGSGDAYSITWGASDWQHGDRFVVTFPGVTDACHNPNPALSLSVVAIDACADPTPLLEDDPVTIPDAAPNVVLRFSNPAAGIDLGSVTLTSTVGTGSIELIEQLAPHAHLVRLSGVVAGDQYILEIDGGAVINPLCDAPLTGGTAVTVDVFGQGTGLTCDSPYWLDSYLATPQAPATSVEGFFDNVDFFACSSAENDKVMSFAFHHLSPAPTTALIGSAGLTSTPGIAIIQTTGVDLCPAGDVSMNVLGCDGYEDLPQVPFAVPGIPLGKALYGLYYTGSVWSEPEFLFQHGPFGESCAAPKPLVVPGPTPLIYLDSAAVDLLDRLEPQCGPFPAVTLEGDTVFSFAPTGSNNRVAIDFDVSGEAAAAVLDGCGPSAEVLACASSASGDFQLEVAALTPGRTYYLVIGGAALDWPPEPYIFDPLNDPFIITTSEYEDVILPFDGDGVAQVTDTGGTSTLALPLHVDYGNGENAAPGDLSFRSIHVPGATQLAVHGVFSVENPWDDFEIWRGPGKLELLFTTQPLADEGVFEVLVASDTVELGVVSDGSISSLDSASYDGIDLQSLTFDTD